MRTGRLTKLLIASLAVLIVPVTAALAEQPKAKKPGAVTAAHDIANFFGSVGNKIYEDCIYELSEEQLEVQQALIQAYVRLGADTVLARQLAVKQIRPPTLSDRCSKIKGTPAAPGSWSTSVNAPDAPVPKKPLVKASLPKGPMSLPPAGNPLASKAVLSQWDCAPGVDYVTIHHKGYPRKLSNGEICSPFEDVVRAVPDTTKTFKFGYTIRTGRLFVISNDANNGRTVAWAISGRDVCRNNPDPDCLAARAIGPLPPGEYSFAGKKQHRVTFGPTIKRTVAGIYLSKLWYRERYTPAQTKAILARSNIAIHVRLKGEMSEACLGLGEKGWAYVAALIREGRATGVAVYIDEPHPQLAEAPPIIQKTSFSLSSLLNQ